MLRRDCDGNALVSLVVDSKAALLRARGSPFAGKWTILLDVLSDISIVKRNEDIWIIGVRA